MGETVPPVQRRSPDLASLSRDVEVLAERLRHLAPARLSPVADVVREHVRTLAALALEAEGLPPRPLPEILADRALGDQLAVLGHDLITALEHRPDAPLLVRAHACLADVRRALP
jgi:hypothetical protein